MSSFHFQFRRKKTYGILTRFVAAAVVFGVAFGELSAGAVRLDFESEGQLPHDGVPELLRRSNGRASEDVIGGCWVGDTSHSVSSLFYAGSLSDLATADANLPMSINVRLKFRAPVVKDRDMWIRFSGPAGTLFLAFKWDGSLINQIGTASDAQGKNLEYKETGANFREFHTFTFLWDPASGVAEGELLVDGTPLGFAGKVDTSIKSTDGYVEFGGQNDVTMGSAWEVDFIRFANDTEILKGN